MASAADDERKLYTNDKIPKDSEYMCDLCAGRFDSPNKLHDFLKLASPYHYIIGFLL
jgi:hypothetical protein